MAVFQFLLDVNGPIEGKLQSVPLEFFSVFGKEVFCIPLYEEEQESFSWLWETLLLEMSIKLESYDPQTVEAAMMWFRNHRIEEVSSFVLEEDGCKRYALVFADHTWSQDLMVTILFQEETSTYEEFVTEDVQRGLYKMDPLEREQQETCYAICGNAMKKALEDPMPEAYFNEVCERKLFHEALPYLILFLIQGPVLCIKQAIELPHYMS